MITDLILGPLLEVATWVLSQLPEGNLTIPGAEGMIAKLSEVNSVIPIGPVIQTAAVMLGALAVFALVRAALTVWNLIWP